APRCMLAGSRKRGVPTTVLPRMPRHLRIYRPLDAYLAALPPEQAEVTLSEATLAEILGPRHAVDSVISVRWNLRLVAHAFEQRDGFHAQYDREHGAISFRRQQPETTRP